MEMAKSIILIGGLLLALQAKGTGGSLLWTKFASVGLEQVSAVEVNATVCGRMTGFVTAQRRLCTAKPLLVPSIRKGVLLAMEECKRQLSKERWNCSTMTEATALKGLLAIPSKETAFVYALTSAAVVHSVTKSCTAGDLPDCACTKPDHKYYGMRVKARCDENFHYGLLFSQLFVDAPDNDEQAKAKFRRSGQNLVNLHNSRAGRKAVVASVKTRCRCYGISNGCALRSCWKVLPQFQEIGMLLKKKYENAVEVMYAKRKRKLKRKANRKIRIEQSELVYMKRSPNYCRSNPRIGISGTSGRVCQKDAENSINSCALLCCGDGYNTEISREKKLCNCIFHWCCRVECDQCEHVYDRYTCK